VTTRPAALPGQQHRDRQGTQQQRQPAAVHDLGQVAGQEQQLQTAEHDPDQRQLPPDPTPPGAGQDQEQARW